LLERVELTNRVEQDLGGIEANKRGKGIVNSGEEKEGQMERGYGDDLPGKGGDATDEVEVCVYEMERLEVEEGSIF
jgi:hypothetical protein